MGSERRELLAADHLISAEDRARAMGSLADLLPCPFCGGDPLSIAELNAEAGNVVASVFCSDCICKMVSCYPKSLEDEARSVVKRRWNRRTAEPPAIDSDLLAALRSALAEGCSAEDLIAAIEQRVRIGGRVSCPHHPEVDPRRMWGCPDCLAELRREAGRSMHEAGTLRAALQSVESRLPAVSDPRAMDVIDGIYKAVRRALSETSAEPGRPWTYCADALPAEAGRYEVAVYGTVPCRLDFSPVGGWEWSGVFPPAAYAWRVLDDDQTPPLRPADRAYLATQGVPAEWLGAPEEAE